MKVSICIIAYNHEEYVAKAIRSILAQRVNFEYEIVVGEDCSTDATRTIVMEFQRRHPDRIRVLSGPENLGAERNVLRTMAACRGEYIAVLDGDDFWICPTKLQRQVDFLDTNAGYSMCFHPVVKVFEESPWRRPEIYRPQGRRSTYTLRDVAAPIRLHISSAVFRRRLIEQFPEWRRVFPFGDWPLYVLSAKYGPIGCIDEVMSVYRIHETGARATFESTRPTDRGAHIKKALELLVDWLPSEERPAFVKMERAIQAKYHGVMADWCATRGSFYEAWTYLGKYARAGLAASTVTGWRFALKALFKISVHGLWGRAQRADGA